MPRRPSRICAGCGKIVGSICVDCHNVKRREYDREQGRPSSTARGYGIRWQRLRKLILHRHPICNHCKRMPSTDVDHIKRKADGGRDTMENLQGLCRGCHNKKTAKENSRRGGVK